MTEPEAADRLRRFGDNEPFRPVADGVGVRVAAAVRSPFVALLAGLGAMFVVVGDTGGAVTVAVMVALAVALRIWQQTRSVRTTRALRDLVTMTVTVRRRPAVDQEPLDREIPLSDVVPGDVVVLHAGDVVPTDLRIVSSTGLAVDESVLSGESLPAAKRSVALPNFGNVLSVLVASTFLPFLPMLPIQLMVQNLLYDAAQLALPWDRVDGDYLRTPQRWQSGGLIRFMLTFGALSSVFDLATFAMLWWVYDTGDSATLFQTGWFLEGLLTQLLVVLVLRARGLPWRGTRPAGVVLMAAAAAAAIGALLPLSPLAAGVRMAPLPGTYALWLIAVTVGYGISAHLVKTRYLRHRQTWL